MITTIAFSLAAILLASSAFAEIISYTCTVRTSCVLTECTQSQSQIDVTRDTDRGTLDYTLDGNTNRLPLTNEILSDDGAVSFFRYENSDTNRPIRASFATVEGVDARFDLTIWTPDGPNQIESRCSAGALQ